MQSSLSITALIYLASSFISLSFFLTLLLRYKRLHLGPAFIGAAFTQSTFFLGITLLDPFTQQKHLEHSSQIISQIWLIESIQLGLWLFALVLATQRLCSNSLPKILRISAYTLSIAIPGLALSNLLSDYLEDIQLQALQWSSIVFSVFCFLSLEQLYRNLPHNRPLRVICLGLGLIFIFDALIYAHNLINHELNQSLWQARASVSCIALAFTTVALLFLRDNQLHQVNLRFSRSVVFYSTSLTISGALLLLLGAGGYYVEFNEASWSSVIFSAIAATSTIAIVLLFSSSQIRQGINVFINKHLFNYKYDYRNEWLKLIDLLSLPTEHKQCGDIAISAAADLFRCKSSALWLVQDRQLVAAEQQGLNPTLKLENIELDSAFAKTLAQGWVFAPSANQKQMCQYNDQLPDHVEEIDHCWLIMPLLVEGTLNGFILLAEPQSNERPNWEDLDLAKTVGRQIASYISRHEQSELLSEARQFEAVNRLSAFLMHDLKNLIAQQSLVVKNAEKHKDNPAFVEDAISTISNSVERMNTLLRKLKQNEPEQIQSIKLKTLILDAVRRCQKSLPTPSLSNIDPDISIKADFDSLVMVFTHLIHNAQDATSDQGFIDIYYQNDNEYALVIIEDNGEGMSNEFIRHKLFRAFESTKAGKGMGVGVFQAKEYIESIGGHIDVKSQVGEGTTFTLSIPTA
ncbi:XrtA/PEP-CTERM system histidine kinase PrsK [Agaribacterium sp. ZY112]|uniref:XrtA/PEP-CTERM system histidine kinase PrsK n=1 Tax=Agaribacterium sp. ZY112 TaxID=3233574 RepID=UPI00352666A6